MSTARKVVVGIVLVISALLLGGYLLLSFLNRAAAGGVAIAYSLTGHTSSIYTTAFSPDDGLLASGDQSGEVKVWEVSSGRQVRALRVPKGEQSDPLEDVADLVGQVMFTTDGKWLIAATGRSVKIWTVASGSEVHSFPDARYPFAVTTDGGIMVSAYQSGALAVWQLANGRQVRLLPGCGEGPGAIAVTQEGTTVACGTNFGENTVKLLDVQSGKEIRSLGGERGDTKAILQLQFSKDSRLLAVATSEKAVVVYEVATGREIRRYSFDPGEILYVETCDASPDLRWLATEHAGGAVSLVELPTTRKRVLFGHRGQTGGFSYSHDGHWFASAGGDKVVKLWRLPPSDSPVTGWPH